ncbi:hypothetical protein [Mucilaginibacter sp. UYCu711]|uniref:hypothetical protein n=1 Tax=Mucilaginibacter sp. UYCu711 TaxID=3156339 RepID=UPI003D1F93F9
MKYSLIFLAIMLIAGRAFAQFGGNTGLGSVWHYPGQIGIEGAIGRSPIGFTYSLSGTDYLTSTGYIKAGASYENGIFNQVHFGTYGGSLIYYYSPYNIQETVFFNVGMGANVSYDVVKDFWYQDRHKINFGPLVGAEVEAAITDYLMLTTSFTQKVMVSNSFGRERYGIQLGIKYLIN